jgi:hypothetical protein
MTTKYFDIHHNELTQSQTTGLEFYFIEFEESGVIKKIEQYKNDVLIGIEYCAYSTSEVNSLKQQFAKVLIKHIYTKGLYLVHEFGMYNNQILTSKLIMIYIASNNKCIYIGPYDAQNNSPKYEECTKYYIDLNGEKRYRFDYKSDGTCDIIIDLQYAQSEIWPEEIGVNPNVTFSWSQFSYYEFAYPEIPTGAI